MADFEYFRAEESDQFSFFRIPKALFTEKEFASLSTDAKVLYGILLDRISLSKKNGWIDSDGYVYIIYTIAELQELLRMSHTTVTKLLYELDSVHGIGLIERYRQGNNRPSVIYVKNFVKRIRGKPVRYFASGTPETGKPDCKELEIRIARNWKSGTQKNRSPDCKNLDGSNTKINKTEKNHTDKSKGNTPALEEKFSQYGSSLTLWNSIVSASKVRRYSVRRSPTPIRYLIASIACKEPMTPPIAPMTPACLQVGTASLGGGFLNTQR